MRAPQDKDVGGISLLGLFHVHIGQNKEEMASKPSQVKIRH